MAASLIAAASMTLAPASASPPHPAQVAAAASSSASHTLLHKDGHGNGHTKHFHVVDAWHYNWGFNCSGHHHGFKVQVRHRDGSPDHKAKWVHRSGHSANGRKHQTADGHLYLRVRTHCHWHVKVVGKHHKHSASPPPAQHACTRTSSGSCIQGGEFCPEADYGQYGYDAQGRRYICTGDPSHPHWETP
jgi:hypothetical protein